MFSYLPAVQQAQLAAHDGAAASIVWTVRSRWKWNDSNERRPAWQIKLAAWPTSMTTVQEQIRHVDPMALGADEVRRLGRELGRVVKPDVRIACGGNVVFDPLTEFLRVHLAHLGLAADFHLIEFGQVAQALLNTESDLHRFAPNFLFLHFEIDELLRGLRQRGRFESPAARESAVDEVVNDLTATVSMALAATDALILLSNFVEDDCDRLGLADWRSSFGEREFFVRLNLRVAKQFSAEPRVQLVDLASVTAQFGRSRARDLRLYLVARIPWHDSFLPWVAHALTRHVAVSLGPARKCLVVDLDNTLWAGVLGEEGARGVRVGTGDATSEAHLRLQQKILAMKERGVVLAICSKNNPEEVAELFSVRTDMPLRSQDFACMQIGWERKDHGLQRIASALNIGTDSLVFLDDSPAEIELVTRAMPEVECILVPADSALRATCLDRVYSLDRTIITAEDGAKTSQYRETALREAARRESADLGSYLRSLETSIRVEPLVPELVARAHQLFMKTNQFNVTGRRYGIPELERHTADPSCMTWMIHAEDRFGDMGWIAAFVLVNTQEACAHLANLVISCRALGRGLEVAILNCIKSICFEINGFERLTAEYRPSKKNSQASHVFDQEGFEITNPGDDLVKRYTLSRERSVYRPCEWIAVQMPERDKLQRDLAVGSFVAPRAELSDEGH